MKPSTSNDKPSCVFETPSKRGALVYLLLPLVAVKPSIGLYFVAVDNEQTTSEKLVSILFLLLFTVLLYAFIGLFVARKLQIWSNAKMIVTTYTGFRWHYSQLTNARRVPSSCTDMHRKRYNMSSALGNLVLVERKNGSWLHVLVSPEDADGLVAAIQGLADEPKSDVTNTGAVV